MSRPYAWSVLVASMPPNSQRICLHQQSTNTKQGFGRETAAARNGKLQHAILASPWLLCYGRGKLRKVYVDKAEARRQESPCQARQQEAKVLKMCSRSIGMLLGRQTGSKAGEANGQ